MSQEYNGLKYGSVNARRLKGNQGQAPLSITWWSSVLEAESGRSWKGNGDLEKASVAWASMCYGCCYSARGVSGVKRYVGASGRIDKWDCGAGWPASSGSSVNCYDVDPVKVYFSFADGDRRSGPWPRRRTMPDPSAALTCKTLRVLWWRKRPSLSGYVINPVMDIHSGSVTKYSIDLRHLIGEYNFPPTIPLGPAPRDHHRLTHRTRPS